MESVDRQNSINSRVWDFLRFRGQQQHGRVYLDTGQIISTLARRFPSEGRPRVFEVMRAIDYLRREGRIRPAAVYGRSVWVRDAKGGGQDTRDGEFGPPAPSGATETPCTEHRR